MSTHGSAERPSPSLALSPGEVHLWLCLHEGAEGRIEPPRWEPLSDSERARALRFHFEPERFQHLLSRLLVRTVLSHYAPLAPRDWAFEADPLGRPRIAHTQAGLTDGLDFNLSHTRGLIALAVTRHAIVGVDVEAASRHLDLALAAAVCSPGELRALQALPPAAQADRLLALWTLKESYAKAIGRGLEMPLARIGFRFEAEGVVFEGDSQGLQWTFWRRRPGPAHALALCVGRDIAVVRGPAVCRAFVLEPGPSPKKKGLSPFPWQQA